jgi:hypothetical protein
MTKDVSGAQTAGMETSGRTPAEVAFDLEVVEVPGRTGEPAAAETVAIGDETVDGLELDLSEIFRSGSVEEPLAAPALQRPRSSRAAWRRSSVGF